LLLIQEYANTEQAEYDSDDRHQNSDGNVHGYTPFVDPSYRSGLNVKAIPRGIANLAIKQK
jgi:hypothetical protein